MWLAGQKGGAELSVPVCNELHLPPGILVPQNKPLLLQQTAKWAANFQLEELKTLHKAGQFDPTVPQFQVAFKSMDLPIWLDIGFKRKEYQCWI